MIPGSANPLLLATAAGAAEEGISRSLRFNSSDSAYCDKTFSSTGNRKTWTYSLWVKKSQIASYQLLFSRPGGPESTIRLSNTDTIEFFQFSGGFTWQLVTTQVFRDPSSWYHFVFVHDSSNATSSDRLRIYVNGARITTFGTASYPSLNFDSDFNTNTNHTIGSSLNGYLADIHFIDGQALDPTSFGEFDDNGIWQPIEYSGSYGTNGFHLPFSDNSTAASLGDDTSGNNNDWTVNNISVTAGANNDSLVDVPTNGTETDTGVGGEVRGNYATLNPLNGIGTISNGNLTQTNPNVDWRSAASTFGMAAGKWYWEVTLTTAGVNTSIGIAKPTVNFPSSLFVGYATDTWGYLAANGEKYTGGTNAAYGATWNTSGTVMGVAFDADAGTLTFYKNNVSQGTAFSGLTSGPYLPAVGNYSGGLVDCNFGQRPFAYTAPSGFKALNTANLPAPVVTKPSEVMDVALYTGNGGTQTISGLEFSPDFVWTKRRDGAGSHGFFDVIRGATKWLGSNSTNSEQTYSDSLTSFDSDGFTLGADTVWNGINQSSQTYVAWTWDAGSSTVSNTDGSISSQVRAIASAGFSIVTYTGNGTAGATIGHGLGVKPSLIICKDRDNSNSWVVQHSSRGSGEVGYLDTTGAFFSSTRWNSTDPTSTVFSVGSNANVNGSSVKFVAYCFAPVDGYSSFGSYTGNGSADGPFVYTGHRSSWILIKRTDSTGNWNIYDTQRNPYNTMNLQLFPNLSDAENTTTGGVVDTVSNGFKLRGTGTTTNASGGTYIYYAVAENPFALNARAR